MYVLSIDFVHTSIDSCDGDTHIPYIYIFKQPYISIHIYILDPGWASLLEGFCYWTFGYPELFINYPKHFRTIYKLAPKQARTIYKLFRLFRGSPRDN